MGVYQTGHGDFTAAINDFGGMLAESRNICSVLAHRLYAGTGHKDRSRFCAARYCAARYGAARYCADRRNFARRVSQKMDILDQDRTLGWFRHSHNSSQTPIWPFAVITN